MNHLRAVGLFNRISSLGLNRVPGANLPLALWQRAILCPQLEVIEESRHGFAHYLVTQWLRYEAPYADVHRIMGMSLSIFERFQLPEP